MEKGVSIFLVLLFAASCYPLLAQEIENDKEQENVEQSIKDVEEKAEKLQTQAFETVDSLSNSTMQLADNTSDSINSLYSHLQKQVQSRIDSLKQKLNELQENGGDQLSDVKGKAAELTSRIDSLQGLLSNKLPLDKLQEYAGYVPGGDISNRLNISNLPGLEKLSLPGMPDLNMDNPNTDNLSIPGGNLSSLTSLENLTSQVNKQLGSFSDLKSNDWIKTDLSDFQQYISEVKQYQEMVKDPSKLDQAVDTQAAQLSELQTLNNETSELAAMKALPESMMADLKRYQDEQALKAQAQEVAVEQATDYFSEHQDKLSEAQSMMTALKKKYSYVPDSRDLSTAVKATSLKNEPLKKRIKFGLGFQLHQTNPISIDLAPNLMYRFNTLFSAGISGTYRASLGIENNRSMSPQTTTDVYGFSAIAQHKVWKGFFAHAEFEYLSSPMKDPSTNTDLESRQWNEGALLGIGKQMALSKGLNGQIIFTYDFLHNARSPNPKAWNIKFGFQLGKLNLKGIRL
jgi:hypothetical protein